MNSPAVREAPARPGDHRLARRRRRHVLGARARQRPSARAGRGDVPPPVRRAASRFYREVADAVAHDADDVVLAAAGVHVERGALQRLGELVPGDGRVALVSDPHVAGHLRRWTRSSRSARGSPRCTSCRRGEEAKTLAALDRLWQELRARPARRRSSRSAAAARPTRPASPPPTYLRGVAVGARADEPRRAGRRGDRRQDGNRPAAGEEPRRRVPLAGAHRHRPGAARDARRARSGARG